MTAPAHDPKDATPVTRAHNRAVMDALPLGNTQDLDRVILGEAPFAEAVRQGVARIAGESDKVAELFGLLDDFALMFEVSNPRECRQEASRLEIRLSGPTGNDGP
jgi:alkyl sulfatase BDS1-like metallo-beta-lactamase superfamily hydrolase